MYTTKLKKSSGNNYYSDYKSNPPSLSRLITNDIEPFSSFYQLAGEDNLPPASPPLPPPSPLKTPARQFIYPHHDLTDEDIPPPPPSPPLLQSRQPMTQFYKTNVYNAQKSAPVGIGAHSLPIVTNTALKP